MQEQPLPFETFSPSQMTIHQSLFPSIIHPDQTNLQEDLIAEYEQYQNTLKRTSLLSKIGQKMSSLCTFSSDLLLELWQQIIPKAIRGNTKSPSLDHTELKNTKDQVFFQEYAKKKVRFFLIVFHPNCQEEEMQEAFQKASFLVVEGRGIRVSELPKQTRSNHWRIKKWSNFKRYTILFFKMDMFGYLLNFGHLAKETIDSFEEDPHFLQNFKKELSQAFEGYEKVQKDFVSSYLQKEDRIAFE